MKLTEKDIELLYRQHYAPLCVFAFQFVADNDLAKDIVQEAFVNLWQRRSGTLLQNPKAYLITSVKNQALNQLKKLRFLRPLDASVSKMESMENAADDEVEKVLEALLKNIPQKSRIIYEMSRVLNLSYAEIATAQNISVKSVEKHISKTLKYLLEELQKRGYHLDKKRKRRKKISNLAFLQLFI